MDSGVPPSPASLRERKEVLDEALKANLKVFVGIVSVIRMIPMVSISHFLLSNVW